MHPALALWRDFPVAADPRPIVTSNRLLAPRGGFTTGAAKVAFLSGIRALGITYAEPSTALFPTDRGPMELPAWDLYIEGASAPARLLAVDDAQLFAPPNPIGQTHRVHGATIDVTGTEVTLAFTGGSDSIKHYTAAVEESEQAAVVSIVEHLVPGTEAKFVAAVGYLRELVFNLERPLAARVLVDGDNGNPVSVTPLPSADR
jgi:hypothetical protein